MRWTLKVCVLLGFAGISIACRSSEQQKTTSSQPTSLFDSPRTSTPIPSVRPNTTVSSFNKAKRYLTEIYTDNRKTIYCDCSFDEKLVIDATHCGYVPQSDTTRARRVEWEHVVPAVAFGQSFPEWRDGHPECINRKGKAFRGRSCARKMAPLFRHMEADMYNLYPAIGELNQRRSSFSMGMIPGEPREFGACDFEISDGVVEPRPAVRGDIARTYLYMDLAYSGRGIVSRKNRKLFEAWDQEDPVDFWECERARRISQVQGNINEVVARACRVAEL